MKPILWRASLRHLQRHPWQSSLAILGVGLGVAVMIAIDVASGSAQRAFELSSSTLTGKATHSVEGGAEGLPADTYRRLRLELGIRPAAPIVESYIAPAQHPERTLHLLGIDPFAEGPFRSYLSGAQTRDLDLASFLATPGTALMAAEAAAELGIEVGDRFEIDAGGKQQSVQLLGFFDIADERQRLATADLLIVDISTAQELLGLEDRVTRIDLLIPDGDEGERALAEVRGILPGDVQLATSATRNESASQMTRAFRLNLQALSLLGLLCGAF